MVAAFQKTASERLREGAKLKPVLSVLVIGDECRNIPYFTFAGSMVTTLNKPTLVLTAIAASFSNKLRNETGASAWLPGAFPLMSSGGRRRAESSSCADKMSGSSVFWQFSNIFQFFIVTYNFV